MIRNCPENMYNYQTISMNLERLDTIRAILSQMKNVANESITVCAPGESIDLLRLPTQTTQVYEQYEDVPQEAIPLRITPQYKTRTPRLTVKLHSAFKPIPQTILAAQPIPQPFIQPAAPAPTLLSLPSGILPQILAFLNTQDLLILSKTCCVLRKQSTTCLLNSALSLKQCEALQWETIINYQYLIRHHAHTFLCNASHNDQQSQHSRDLDRTFLVQEQGDVDMGSLSRLDRVLRALGTNIEYFQSLNYITAAFLNRYDQQLSYWCTRYLLHKINYFQTNLPLLHCHIALLSSLVERQLPAIYNHLNSSDLSLEYFADRWLIPLLSYDTDLDMMLRLWRLICLADSNVLVCFVLVMLKKLEKRILEADEEGLNYLLKFNLKAEVKTLNSGELLRETVDMYVANFTNKVDLQMEIIEEEVKHNPTTAPPVKASANP